ncbi:hypothetical protein M404DRAFT_30965 [Pisolithus tinctorius Marx 270]|uniref:Uncharacterized protein n=1 Tax=Pisolithus tinctorius Marx 270 TaxID=870435 RepID=A0A0C3NCG4_PISTI|nr:hypothetical protein M404DRAFT_30965 [Pisolithus tinctorius Marx 270]
MPPEKQIVLCESCGKSFKPTGIGPYRKSCIRCAHKTNEDLAHFDRLRRQDVIPGVTDNGRGSNIEVNTEPAPEPTALWPMNMDLELPASTIGTDDKVNVAQPATDSNNNIDDIQVKYHPNAGKPIVKVLFAEFS